MLCACGRYQDFRLPLQPGGPAVAWHWEARPDPVLTRGGAGEWDSVDVLNPSVLRQGDAYYNLYSGYDGRTWHTGLAVSADGLTWRKEGTMLSPDPRTWEGDAIAANGSAVADESGAILYYYQAGQPPEIGLARSANGHQWRRQGPPVLPTGPRGSWDERGVADPYVIHIGRSYYMFYEGMDRARRQRLGVATSDDGVTWYKLRRNPILELGAYGAFDENGLGEPAVWVSNGYYWMLYTGQDRGKMRKLGLARSRDGVDWEKHPLVIAGDQPWDSKVLCDPTVLVENGRVRVWFGGGDVPSPDQNLNGQIGSAMLTAQATK
ncbi:MAG TPA: hypothetical protein VEV17_16580 [Bryobacteraceae bacterium]|nr:hypothetical protein [Bryobacteraceae bacterium]